MKNDLEGSSGINFDRGGRSADRRPGDPGSHGRGGAIMKPIIPTRQEMRRAAILLDCPVFEDPKHEVVHLVYLGWLYRANGISALLKTKKLNHPEPRDYKEVTSKADQVMRILIGFMRSPDAQPDPGWIMEG